MEQNRTENSEIQKKEKAQCESPKNGLNTGFFLELLTRFELVTHFPQKVLLRGPTVYHGAAPQTPAACAAKDEVAKK